MKQRSVSLTTAIRQTLRWLDPAYPGRRLGLAAVAVGIIVGLLGQPTTGPLIVLALCLLAYFAFWWYSALHFVDAHIDATVGAPQGWPIHSKLYPLYKFVDIYRAAQLFASQQPHSIELCSAHPFALGAILRGLAHAPGRRLNTLLTAQPAVYLHSSLKRTISRRRVLHVMRWTNPKLKERNFLRGVPTQLAELEAQSIQWIDALPTAIWNPAIDAQESWAGWAVRQPGLLLAPWLPAGWVHKQAQQASIIEHRLPTVLQTIEVLIEEFQRLQMYSLEIRATQQLKMPFDSWQQLTPPDEESPAGCPLMYIVFAEPLLLEHSS